MAHNIRGYYIGADDDLKGEHALIQVRDRGLTVIAQFDNVKTGLGFRWHPYEPSDFFLYAIDFARDRIVDVNPPMLRVF